MRWSLLGFPGKVADRYRSPLSGLWRPESVSDVQKLLTEFGYGEIAARALLPW